MAEFQGHLCWDTATATATINTEAVSPPRAVFLATHAPLRIQRAALSGSDVAVEGTPVDEQTVLDDFLNRRSDSGTLLMPIVGDSGSGKSHLVRWAREQIQSTNGREVIYLEKAKTSLKAVITALLSKVNSDELTQLRADIDKFTAGADKSTLARRLVNALDEALATTTSRDVSGPARVLAGTRGLAVVLQDPHVREYMLAPGKFIPQLAEQLLHDRTEGKPERPERFTVDDLPLDIADIKQAAAVTQRLLNTLNTRDDLQSAAVELLNTHLESAVKNAFNLGAGRLPDAMMQVRREYARQGKEIILLIEDFALIQGVQRDLLDAVIEAANREGKTTLAPIRTLMAVTTGYFGDLPETALTRIRASTGYVYDLDVPFSEDDNGAAHIMSFAGRYLNAARLGRDELERTGDDIVPNHCDSCLFRARCHGTFGATAEGYGLYPFNEPALLRAIHATALKDKPWAFVPRAVLGSVIRPVLIEHARSLQERTFPSPLFREQFPTAAIDDALTTAVRADVESNDHTYADRRNLVLEFWGNAPTHANALDPALLEAFGLDPLRVGEDERPPTSQRNAARAASTSTATSTAGVPRSLSDRLQYVEDWVSRDEPLRQAVASDIRGVIAEAVAQRYRWTDPLMQEQPKLMVWDKAWPAKSTVVSIEEAKGELLAGTGNAPIRFKRNALNSQFFQSVLCAKFGGGQPRAEDIRRLSTIAEQYAPAFTSALQRHLEISEADLVLGLRASLLGAALAGRAWPGMDESSLLSVALDDGEDWTRADIDTRTQQWTDVLTRHMGDRRGLVERIKTSVGVSQGTGAPRMIDAARVLLLLRDAMTEWDWRISGTGVPQWVKPAVTGFASWTTLIDDQTEQLERQLRDIRLRQPRGAVGVHTLAAVRDALIAAREVGLPLSSGQAQNIEMLLQRAGTADWTEVSKLEDDLAKVEGAEWIDEAGSAARIIAAVRDRGESIEAIRQVLIASDEWLDEALCSASSRTSDTGERAATGVQELINEWRSVGMVGRETQ